MKVLALGAHFDDVEIGCGGSLARHAARGDEVQVYVATHSGYVGADGRQGRDPHVAAREGRAALALLGITEVSCGDFATNNLLCNEALVLSLRRVMDSFQPDLVYTHWLGDAHLDHHNLARATLSAARHVPSILCYRSNDYAGPDAFDGRCHQDISSHLEQKRSACLQHVSEVERGLGTLIDRVLAHNRLAGEALGTEAVESFEVIRLLNL